MKITFLTLYFVLISISSTFSQSNKNVSSLLWTVEYPGANHCSYILGTNHGLGQDWLNRFSFLKQLISSSDAMYSETGNMPKTTTKVELRKLISAKSISAIFDKDSLLVDDFVTSYLQLPIPFSQMLIFPEIAQTGYEGQKKLLLGIDALIDAKLIADLSNQNGLKQESFHIEKIEVLDNLLEKMAIPQIPLYSLDNETELNELIQSAKFEPTEIVTKIKDLKKYQNGNSSKWIKCTERMLQLYYNGKEDFSLAKKIKITPSVRKSAIERNNQWVAKLTEELKHKNLFVAFGAAHLFMMEKYGVLDQLKKAGFCITPIDMLEYAAKNQTLQN